MKHASFLLPYLFLATLAAAQTTTPAAIPITAEPSHHVILENEYVRVLKIEVAPHAQMQVHRHDHDYAFITFGEAEIENTVTGKDPVKVELHDGEVRFRMGGFSHTARNLSDHPLRNIAVEFLRDSTHAPATDYAPSPSPSQKILFIQDGVRVSEIRLAAGASLPRHTHKGPHLVIAISDIDLRSDADARPPREVHQKSEDAVWVPGGFTHTLTNIGTAEAHFIALEFE